MIYPDPPPLIGFIGKEGCGKSTAANVVMRNFNPITKPLSFARPLKAMIMGLLTDVLTDRPQIRPADYLTPTYKNEPIAFLGGVTPRYLMQTLGTEWGRNCISEDFWVMLAAVKVERMLGAEQGKGPKKAPLAVFDDVRFPNEVEMIHAYGGVTVRIERPDRAITPGIDLHASERAETLQADHVVVNDGTQADLEARITALFPADPNAKTRREINEEKMRKRQTKQA